MEKPLPIWIEHNALEPFKVNALPEQDGDAFNACIEYICYTNVVPISTTTKGELFLILGLDVGRYTPVSQRQWKIVTFSGCPEA